MTKISRKFDFDTEKSEQAMCRFWNTSLLKTLSLLCRLRCIGIDKSHIFKSGTLSLADCRSHHKIECFFFFKERAIRKKVEKTYIFQTSQPIEMI